MLSVSDLLGRLFEDDSGSDSGGEDGPPTGSTLWTPGGTTGWIYR